MEVVSNGFVPANEDREELHAHPGYELIWEEYPSGESRWTTSLKTLFGYELSEPPAQIREWWMERVHPDDRDGALEEYRRAFESGATHFSRDYRFRRKDGRYVWVCTRGTIERDAQGRVVRMIGGTLDIERFREAEEALLKSRHQLLEAQRAGHVRVWEDDLVSGRVTTDFQPQLTGAPPAEGSRPFEEAFQLVHPDDRAQLLEARREAIEGGAPMVAEFRVRLPGGKERVLLSRGEVVRDGAGRALRIVGTAVDITERKRVEEDLRKTQRLLVDAAVLGNTGSWEMDVATGEVRATEENRRLFFGEDPERGKRVGDYAETFHPEDRHLVMDETKRIAEGGEPRDIEYRIIRPDGTLHLILGRTRVIRDETGRAVRTYGTNVDITERKRVEEELARRARQHAAAAQIGLSALRSGDLHSLFKEAAASVAFALEVDCAAVMESLPGDLLLLRAGAGAWKEGAVGAASACEGLLADAMRATSPVASEDLRTETPGALLVEHGITSGASVVIQGGRRPFGVLAALAKKPRTWSQDDLNFLQTTAHILATTIERERVAAELRVKREQLQSLSRLLIQAQENERRAVARELHDDFGQVLTAIKLNLERTGSESPHTAENIVLVEQALQRMRELAYGLRPPLLDELGLGPALRWYVGREAKRAGLEAQLSVADLRLPVPVETTCFRVVQEALTNVARHAQARRVDVTLSRVGNEVHLTIGDDGRGFNLGVARARAAMGDSQGLLGMQERVSLAGGELDIDSTPGRGTTVLARFRIAETP
jgi:PAS domain S-box-containing protein